MITKDELRAIKHRSDTYSASLGPVPVEDLSDIGLMCRVDIPRLLQRVEELEETLSGLYHYYLLTSAARKRIHQVLPQGEGPIH